MLEGIKAALAGDPPDGRIRLVFFLTDGFIGNDDEILKTVREKIGAARIFPLGVGSSPNRYLLDGMARAGRGAVRTVRHDATPERVEEEVDAFYDRVAKPFLTDLTIDWNGLEVADLYPPVLPDLFAGQPVELVGRYRAPGTAEIVLRGRLGGVSWRKTVSVTLPEAEERNASLATIWARARIGELTRKLRASGGEEVAEGTKKEIIALATEFRLASKFTAFVAVDERVVVGPDGKTKTVRQPLPLPEGTAYEGFFGKGAVGIGGGAGGSFGGRGGHRHLRARGGGAKTQGAVDLGLEWLKNHQEKEGRWDSDGFMRHDKVPPACDGPGAPDGDVRTTALTLLVYLGAGETHKHGRYKKTVRECLRWLKANQGPTGGFGEGLEDHALASLAMCEAYGLTGSPLFKASAEQALDHLDACLRGAEAAPLDALWAVCALHSATRAGLRVDAKLLEEAAARVRAGPGGGRTLRAAEAVARIFAGEDPKMSEAVGKIVAELAKDPPSWDEADLSRNDPLYWFLGTVAMFQHGGEPWKVWNPGIKDAVIDRQRRGGISEKGSWDPVGPDAKSLGRVGATALMQLTVEIYYRYARVFGTN
jgi:hypothetical protein